LSKNLQKPEEHHEELVKGLYDQMKMILDSSEQPSARAKSVGR
jgi:hypothetical protein